jgi:hypothetical protein
MIAARLSFKDGKARSMEAIIELPIKEYEGTHKGRITITFSSAAVLAVVDP